MQINLLHEMLQSNIKHCVYYRFNVLKYPKCKYLITKKRKKNWETFDLDKLLSTMQL